MNIIELASVVVTVTALSAAAVVLPRPKPPVPLEEQKPPVEVVLEMQQTREALEVSVTVTPDTPQDKIDQITERIELANKKLDELKSDIAKKLSKETRGK